MQRFLILGAVAVIATVLSIACGSLTAPSDPIGVWDLETINGAPLPHVDSTYFVGHPTALA
jgi:hypothetical protein